MPSRPTGISLWWLFVQASLARSAHGWRCAKKLMTKLTIKLIISALVLFSTVAAYADSFENLSVMDVTGFNTIKIRYDKAITKIINEPIKDDRGIRVLVTHLVKNSPARYLIVFDPGPSDDPEFIIYEIDNNREKKIISLGGQELILPGNGVLYTSGFVDMMFNTRKKFVLHDGIIEEVRQPFYYVGLKTLVNTEVILYEDTSYNKEIAKLPNGSKVEVLINSKNDYLLKTPCGLVGWVRINYGEACWSATIKDLCFHGD